MKNTVHHTLYTHYGYYLFASAYKFVRPLGAENFISVKPGGFQLIGKV